MSHIHIPKYAGNISDKSAKYFNIPMYQYTFLLIRDHDAYQSITDIQSIMTRAHNQHYK